MGGARVNKSDEDDFTDDNCQLHRRAFADTSECVKGDLYIRILLGRVAIVPLRHTDKKILTVVTRCELVGRS